MLSRRHFLKIAAGAMSSLAWPENRRQAACQEMKPPDLALILLADLHSGYGNTAQLLHAVRAVVREHEAHCPVQILINGDIFEGGNIVAARNGGLIDFALLDELTRLAPVSVAIGNHDSDLFDPAEFVAQVTRRGARIVTDIVDPRTGQLYGEPSAQFKAAGGQTVRLAAMGTPSMFTYPEKYRACYRVPPPGVYAKEHLGKLFVGSDLNIALVHARLEDDQAVLPFAGSPCIVYGGHEHLRFTHREPGGLHLQSGAWSHSFVAVTARFTAGGAAELHSEDFLMDRQGPADAPMAALIQREMALHLTAEDNRTLGALPEALDLDHAVLFAAEAVRRASGADVAFLGHTTFGDGLPAGPVTAYDLSSFVRFDGPMAGAEVDGATLIDTILPRTNQFGDYPYERRIGDYLYASAIEPKRDRRYKIVVNAFVASAPALTEAYFGTAQMKWKPVPDVKLKAAVIAALGSGREKTAAK
jgi:2',3'-cyclic-nucleotide 2'-phosphodiesterase (5'-nucleotidase family)